MAALRLDDQPMAKEAHDLGTSSAYSYLAITYLNLADGKINKHRINWTNC
jgi:hypothetical protein